MSDDAPWNGMYFLSTSGFMYERIYLYYDRIEKVQETQLKFSIL